MYILGIFERALEWKFRIALRSSGIETDSEELDSDIVCRLLVERNILFFHTFIYLYLFLPRYRNNYK